jgi:hypothetical protein
MENYGVSVHYSSAHHDYYSAWCVLKKSTDIISMIV